MTSLPSNFVRIQTGAIRLNFADLFAVFGLYLAHTKPSMMRPNQCKPLPESRAFEERASFLVQAFTA